ncbi:dihydroneopterin aldolase [Curtobacterium flaccumfaciens]|nr:dihydroneopterin aldolase [Curtobacterium flaccumfaciens]
MPCWTSGTPGGQLDREGHHPTDRVRARGHHGVFDHERADGQEFVVDVAVEVDARAASDDDDLERTVHYGVLAEQVVAEIERDPVDLIETLAERIAGAVLAHRAALATEVTVHKPQAPITVPFTDVSITIRRSRDGGGAAHDEDRDEEEE